MKTISVRSTPLELSGKHLESTMQTATTTTMMSMKERLFSFGRALGVKDLASIFGVTEATIYKQARQGTIPSFRIGTLVRFDPKLVCEWYEKQ